ncbi:MAG: serine/threonine protein kinase [Bacteroidaceae bacterium]|nr:serine/threonine protein kinase [Bacteroidaceae bacterium]
MAKQTDYTDDSFSGFEVDTFEQLQRDFTEVQLVCQTPTHQLYRAKRFGRWYLLKALCPEMQNSAAHQQMLLKEMEVLMRLQHPNIIGCLGMERTEVGECIVMEYVDGQTLSEWLAQEENLVPSETERIISELLSALTYLHTAGITHRDLKPSNVMLTRNGNFVKIIDFSLADTDTHAILKQPSGTAQYMSPEQATTSTPDVRNDIYSLGVIMQKLPLQGFWHKIAERCLLPIDQRYANIQELQADIDRYKRRAVRRRWMIPLAVLAFLLLAGAASIYKLDADRRAMYQQLNRIPIATARGMELMEKQIMATGLSAHTDTLTAWRYLDPQINEKILAANAFAYNYVEEQLTDFTDKEREEVLIAMLDRWQAWQDTITSRAKHIISLDTLYNNKE